MADGSSGSLRALSFSQVAQRPWQRPSSASFLRKRLQSVGTSHSSVGTRDSMNPYCERTSYGGSATPWLIASMRQRPTLMCLFFFWTFSAPIGSAACRIRSYALRQRLLSPFSNE